MNATSLSPHLIDERTERRATGGIPPSLLGRDDDVRQVLHLIDSDEHQIVTLLGPGGVGKTRLAQEVAARAGPSFAHGAMMVPLDAVRDAALVPVAVARSLGYQESGERRADELLAELLPRRHMLLLLDNFEQVTGAAAPWLTDLLSRSPRLKVLVTSRIALHISGEQQFIVRPLPTSGTASDQNPALALFIQRARAVRPDFLPDDRSTKVIEEICAQLDGLPLAIELAAARVMVLSPEALLARLTDRLTVLTGGLRDAPARLRSMRDAIAWSYDLLSLPDQRLFRRLSVFLGGFSLEAVESVAAWPAPAGTETAALDVLQSLVDQSLIQVAPDAAGPRYRMLETIREYGAERIVQERDESAEAAHADYIRDLARRAEPQLTGPDQARWLESLDADYANIRAAVSSLERHDRLDDAIELYAGVIAFVDVRGHTVEVQQHLESWLTLPQLNERTRSRRLLLYAVGVLLHNMNGFHRGVDVLQEAVEILTAVGDRYHAVIAKAYLGVMLAFIDNYARMQTVMEEAIEEAQAVGHHRAWSLATNMLSEKAWIEWDDEANLAYANRALAIASEQGDLWMIPFCLLASTIDAMEQGRLDEADRLARESMRIREEIGSKRDLPADWTVLAWLAKQRGDLEHAETYVTNGLTIAEETGHTSYITALRLQAAVLAVQRHDLAQARALLTPLVGATSTDDEDHALGRVIAAYTQLALAAGDPTDAARFLGASYALDPGYDRYRAEPYFMVDRQGPRTAILAVLGPNTYEQERAVGASWTATEATDHARAYEPSRMHIAQTAPKASPILPGLSPRELEVLLHMASGLSNQQIADTLFVSHRTVTTHVTNIMTKLDVASRTAAVAWAIRNRVA